MLKVERLVLGPFDVNCYLVYDEDSGEAMVVDPAVKSEDLIEHLNDKTLKYIVNTHGHFDHIGGNAFLKSKFPNTPLMIHGMDAQLLLDPANNLSTYFIEPIVSIPADLTFQDEDHPLSLGAHTFRPIFVPGHTPGGIALYSAENKIFISGDLIFPHSVGRTDMPGGDSAQLKESILKIIDYADDTMVYPGHEDPFPLSEFKADYRDILAFEV